MDMGATVITNLFSAIPYIGGDLVQWIWGGFAVDNATLTRFFSLHFLLPFVVAGLRMVHLLFLHQTGRNNPLGINRNFDKVSFHPYFSTKDGKIRLHDCVEKRAKTCLPGLGNAVKAIQVSGDGRWILATCSDYICVIPTSVPSTDRTGFEGRGMGKLKPHPYILRLKPADIQKYKLRKVEFTKAQFDQGDNIDEHWIITSTGPYIIRWNFSKLKKAGIVNSYSIRKTGSKVIHNEFR